LDEKGSMNEAKLVNFVIGVVNGRMSARTHGVELESVDDTDIFGGFQNTLKEIMPKDWVGEVARLF
jgi:hypothetical protein